MKPFNPENTALEKGTNLVEASAGTGKTYALTMLVLRFIIEKQVSIEEIVVVTFTRAATKELRERIRTKLIETLDILTNQHTPPDDTTRKLINNITNKSKATDLLATALKNIDTLNVFTIHSFCQKILKEYALESGELFDAELDTNIEALQRQITADFWRKNLYQMDTTICSIITGKFPTPGKLLASISSLPHETKIIPNTPAFENTVVSFKKYSDQFSSWWLEHGDNLVSSISKLIADDKFRKKFPENFTNLFSQLNEFLNTDTGKIPDKLEIITLNGFSQALNGNKFRGKAGEERKELLLSSIKLPDHILTDFIRSTKEITLAIRMDLIKFLQAETESRLQENSSFSYDYLIGRLAKNIKNNFTLQKLIGKSYAVAMIDEFQDTDSHQFEIFSSIFGTENHYLYLIGDPKQAIYKFRGADIFSYFKASKLADNKLNLEENYRSNPYLVEAINKIFQFKNNDTFLIGKDTLAFHPSRSGINARNGQLIQGKNPSAPFVFCQIDKNKDGEQGKWNKDTAQEPIANFLIKEILHLTNSQNHKKYSISEGNNKRDIKPGDIAILVRKHEQANYIQNALRHFNIPSSVKGNESIFETDTAQSLLTIMEAIINNRDRNHLKLAMSTSFFGYNCNELYDLWQDDQNLHDFSQCLQHHLTNWQKKSFFTMFNLLAEEKSILITLAKHSNNEREITDLLHLAELIQQTETEKHFLPEQTCNWLQKKITHSKDEQEKERRLESDSDNISIITMHSSKGLEFPIVFCPYLWDFTISSKSDSHLALYHNDDNQFIADLGSDSIKEARKQGRKESLAEEIRMIYVAMTRAKYRNYTIWCHTKNSLKSGLSNLIFNAKASFEDQSSTLMDIAKDKENFAYILINDDKKTSQIYKPGRKENTLLPPLEAKRELKTNRQMTSYSGLASLTVHNHATGETLPDKIKTDFPPGAAFGNLVHDLLEHNRFKQWLEPKDFSDTILPYCNKYNLNIKPRKIQNLLKRVVSTTLNHNLDNKFNLSEIKDNSTLKEMPFYIPIKKITTLKINAILAKSPTFNKLSKRTIEGYLTGFIDLIVEHNGKFYIIDYKSNYLGYDKESYSYDNMRAAMQGHNYGLQYWIYSLVIDKYLNNRLADYNYKQHFGGVMYLFVRGMNPLNPGSGVFFDKPDESIIRQLEKII